MTENTDTTTIEAEPTGSEALNRRRFFGAAGAVGAAAFLAACGSDDGDDGATPTTAAGEDPTTTEAETTTTAAEETTTTEAEDDNGDDAAGDLEIGAFAASLEVLAVNTYGAALDAAEAGDLGEVPEAVAEFVTTARDHHQAHLDAWNAVLSDAGEDEVTDPPSDLEATVNEEFGNVTDVGGAAQLALMLEQIAAATYLSVIPELSTEGAIELASSIQPIDMQHAAVLLFALGEYPVPDTFARTDMAASPS